MQTRKIPIGTFSSLRAFLPEGSPSRWGLYPKPNTGGRLMAIYHFSVKTISRSDGRSATAAIAYRSGSVVIDARVGLIHDYSHKKGVLLSKIIVTDDAPAWAHDREQLWNEVEFAEKRKNSTVAREIIVALPHELSPAARAELVLKFVHELVKRHGFGAEVCIHLPDGNGDNRNHHAHILLTTRKLEKDGFTDKIRELDAAKTGAAIITEWRARWATLQNEALQLAGVDARVDHRSLKEQGITDRLPGWHQGAAATAMMREGKETGFKERREDAEAEFQARVDREAAAAAQLEIDRLNALLASLNEQRAEAEAEALQREQEHEQAVKLSEQAFMARTGWDVVDDNHDDDGVNAAESLSERASRLRAESDRLLSVAREYRLRPQKPDIYQIKNNHKIKIQMLNGDIKSFSVSDINSMLENAESNLSNQLNLHSKKGLIGQLIESRELRDARQKHHEINDLLNQVTGIVNSDKVEKIINNKYDELAKKYNQEAHEYNAWENESRGHEEADRLASEAEREAHKECERLHPELAQESDNDHGLSL